MLKTVAKLMIADKFGPPRRQGLDAGCLAYSHVSGDMENQSIASRAGVESPAVAGLIETLKAYSHLPEKVGAYKAARVLECTPQTIHTYCARIEGLCIERDKRGHRIIDRDMLILLKFARDLLNGDLPRTAA